MSRIRYINADSSLTDPKSFGIIRENEDKFTLRIGMTLSPYDRPYAEIAFDFSQNQILCKSVTGSTAKYFTK